MSSLEIKKNNNKYNVIIKIDKLPTEEKDNFKKIVIGNSGDFIFNKIIKNGDNSFNIAYNYNNKTKKNFINYIYLIINTKKFVINIEKEFEEENKNNNIEIKIEFIKTIEKDPRQLKDEQTGEMYTQEIEIEKWSIEHMSMTQSIKNLLETKILHSFSINDYFYFVETDKRLAEAIKLNQCVAIAKEPLKIYVGSVRPLDEYNRIKVKNNELG
jgi:hypothetical protein